MQIVLAIIALVAVAGLPTNSLAQDSATRATSLMNTYKQSVVRISVSGTRPNGTTKRELGSGFVVAYDSPYLFIVTAGHVIGNSSPTQSDNPNWYVDPGGRVDRKIVVSGVDGTSVWRDIGEAEHVPLTVGAQIDLALIVVTNGPELPPLPLMRSRERIGTREIMLMGYHGEGKAFRTPIPIGKGARSGFREYMTDKPSLKGESGGPWIDVLGGAVVAIASRVDTSSESPSMLAVPADFILSTIGPLLGQRQALLKIQDDSGPIVRFAVLKIEGGAEAQIAGTKLTSSGQGTSELGEVLRLLGNGTERSDCDSDSGRTTSAAEIYAKVVPTTTQELVFDYKLRAQGGHFRTAIAGCLGPNLIGLKGNDTTAGARLQMNGNIAFEAPSDKPLALNWTSMPGSGAAYKLYDENNSLVLTGQMAGSSMKQLTLPKAGKYRLEAIIDRSVSHVGASGAPAEAWQSQIAVKPAS